MAPAIPRRIDTPDREVAPLRRRPVAGIEGHPAVSRADAGDDGPSAGPEFEYRIDAPHRADSCSSAVSGELQSPQAWLHLHATDLVDRLQAWASDLDAREAQLNARSSLQDHRERRFRLQQQDVSTELAEQQRAIERLRREIQTQARRLAFLSEPPAA